MAHDEERAVAIEEALRDAGLDALVCALPANVLLLSGYAPVVGSSVALTARGGRLAVLVPEDERELAAWGRSDEVVTFEPASLTDLRRAEDAVREPLGRAARALLPGRGRVGYESGGFDQPASYSAVHLYGPAFIDLLREAFPGAETVPAGNTLERLRAVKTPREVTKIRESCRIAGRAFVAGATRLRRGVRETQAAAAFHSAFADAAGEAAGEERVGGFFYCMSGPDAALASAAYARSRARTLGAGETVLVHCNTFAGGYWTDVTRTYCIGRPQRLLEEVYTAVFEARTAAFAAVRPGVTAAAVDHAARAVLEARGFGPAFKHATGHGVGFGAIGHDALPRVHPRSGDVLRQGMVFNVEPAVYLDGVGGVRHCDMVAVTADGAELLTPFQSSAADLLLPVPP